MDPQNIRLVFSYSRSEQFLKQNSMYFNGKVFSLLSQSVISFQDYVTKELSSYRLVNGSVLSMMKSRKALTRVNNIVKTMDLTGYSRLGLWRIASLQTHWNFVSTKNRMCFHASKIGESYDMFVTCFHEFRSYNFFF